MLMIGLTGGIGAGKTAAVKTLRERGAVVTDADRIAREVLAPGTPGLEAVVDAFGEEILQEDGSLDRRALAQIVFDDPVARKLLNAVVHPRVYQETTRVQRAAPREAIVVHDIPLIVENGVAGRYHLVVVIAASEKTRVKRIVADRGLSEAEALARVRAQATDEERKAVADVWVKNEGTPEDLRRAMLELWFDRLVPFNENLLAGRVAAAGGAVVTPDREWPVQAERLANRIRFVSGELVQRISHVGPTAQGQAATDVIDLEIDVRDAGDAERLAPILVAAGFPPEAGARLRHGSADPGRPARLHIRPGGMRVSPGTYR